MHSHKVMKKMMMTMTSVQTRLEVQEWDFHMKRKQNVKNRNGMNVEKTLIMAKSGMTDVRNSTAGLSYHWLLVIKLAGPFPRAHDKGVVIKQKPLLWFTKGKRKARVNGCDYIANLIESSSPSERKNYHPWAQSCAEAQQIISKLTLQNQTVMDPMMGSGTTGNAALKLGRKFIGVERDPNRFAIAKSYILTPH